MRCRPYTVGLPGQFVMDSAVVKYRSFSNVESVHYHPHLHMLEVYVGSDPLNVEDFDAEIELFLGPEWEKQVIDSVAVAYQPNNLIHIGAEVRRVGKPFVGLYPNVHNWPRLIL